MANPIQWTDVGAVTLAIAGDASSPTLKNLAAGGLILSNEIDPGATPDSYADFRLRVRFASAPVDKEIVFCYFLIDVGDAGAYEDGSITVEPNRNPDLFFSVRAVSTQQVIAIRQAVLPKSPFKILLKNDATPAFTNTNDENQLHYSVYNEEIQ